MGVLSTSNDNPLEARDTVIGEYLFDVTSVVGDTAVLTCRQANRHGVANYLGAILSADRNVVIWQNNTRPLP